MNITRHVVTFISFAFFSMGAVAQTACDGCKQFIITYEDGYYLGHQSIPGVVITFTPGIGTGPGACDGNEPNCAPNPCTYNKGVLRISNNGTVSFDVRTYGSDVVRGTLQPTDGSDFPIKSKNGPTDIDCGYKKDVLTLDIPQTDETVRHMNVALLCTACPGSDPY